MKPRFALLAPGTCAVLLLLVSLTARGEGWRPPTMERDQEIAEALSAGPESIREKAGVYVLGTSGYELVRESGNGFHCLIGRSQKDAYEPQCFDAEGSATLMRQVLMRGELQMGGVDADEIDRQIGLAWAEGRLRAPSRPGINYMLSPDNRVPVGPDRVIPYGSHLMFYVPYLTNEDVGGDPAGSSPMFVINEGQPGAYVIVPVAESGGHTHTASAD